MDWNEFLKLAIDEWETSFSLFVAVVGGVWLVVRFLYRHQLDNLNSTITNQQSIIKAHEADISGLKTEIEKLTKEIAKSQVNAGPTRLLPVTHGNEAIRNLYYEVTSHPSVPIPTHPTDSSKWKHVVFTLPTEEFERLAAARRLTEWGLTKVNEPAPGTFTLTASTEAIDLRSFFDQYIKDEKSK